MAVAGDRELEFVSGARQRFLTRSLPLITHTGPGSQSFGARQQCPSMLPLFPIKKQSVAGARKCVTPWVGSGTDSTYHCGNSFDETPLLKGPVAH